MQDALLAAPDREDEDQSAAAQAAVDAALPSSFVRLRLVDCVLWLPIMLCMVV